MKKISLDKIIFYAILIIMIGIPVLKFASYVPFISRINPYLVSRSRVYFFWGSIVFLFVLYIYSVLSKERKINYIDFLFYFLILSLFISTTFSVDFKTSFLGEEARYEGLLTLFNYYLLALNAKNLMSEKYKKGLIKCFIFLGIFQSLYAILQSLTPFIYMVSKFSGGVHMAMGLCSNPNFFGAYMAMQLSIITIYFMKTGNFKYLFVYSLFTMALYLASSSGPVLGYILSFVLMCVINRKHFKRMLLLLLIFLLTMFITDSLLKYVHNDVLNNQITDRYIISNDIANTIDKIETNNIDSIGSGRIGLWRKSLPLIKEYWLTGSGLDTFGHVYPQSGRVYFDKAHNIYIQMGVTNGVFPLIVYMFICLVVFIKGFKLKKTHSVSIFMLFVSYCILAFANISVIDVAPYFYIFLGMLISDTNKVKFSLK